MRDKISIIGSGALGTSLAKVLHDGGHKNIVIYGVDHAELEELSKGFNSKYFPKNVEIPKFKTTDDLKEALSNSKYILLAVPSKVMNIVLEKILDILNTEVLIINGSKGFYPNSDYSLHKGIVNASKRNSNVRGVVSLIGPSHAEEIILGRPTIVASVDKNKKLCKEVQKLFSNDYFKIYVQTDVRGAEVGAAYKNVLAIASGMAEGLGFGINTIAALLTRGMAEMQIFNKEMKGKAKTLSGLTGMGDMIVTATSDLSRNYTLGKNIAIKGKAALDTDITVEGLVALEKIHKIASNKKIVLPIVEFLFQVVKNDKNPNEFVKKLWHRSFKSE